jgi:hypothetical protein
MEAIREGVQDHEYLAMLRKRVEELERQDNKAESLAAARALLDSACDRVLAAEKGTDYRWDAYKDRSIADRVRVEILESLVELGQE